MNNFVIVFFFFFFKQKTAYEIMPSLVGSEMCIRDSCYMGKIPRESAAAVLRIPGAYTLAGTLPHLLEQFRCRRAYDWRSQVSIFARSPDFATARSSRLIFPPHRRRRNGLFGLLRIIHRIARAFDGVVQI